MPFIIKKPSLPLVFNTPSRKTGKSKLLPSLLTGVNSANEGWRRYRTKGPLQRN